MKKYISQKNIIDLEKAIKGYSDPITVFFESSVLFNDNYDLSIKNIDKIFDSTIKQSNMLEVFVFDFERNYNTIYDGLKVNNLLNEFITQVPVNEYIFKHNDNIKKYYHIITFESFPENFLFEIITDAFYEKTFTKKIQRVLIFNNLNNFNKFCNNIDKDNKSILIILLKND